MVQETTKSLNVVQEMLSAFGKGDMEALKQTLSENTVWVYHGTEGIPYNDWITYMKRSLLNQ